MKPSAPVGDDFLVSHGFTASVPQTTCQKGPFRHQKLLKPVSKNLWNSSAEWKRQLWSKQAETTSGDDLMYYS
jgi:hypothetical protein